MESAVPQKTYLTGKRRFQGPVGWLLGRDMIAALKYIALYGAFGKKLDPRDWMQANVTDFADRADGGEFWFDYMADCWDGQRAMYSIAYLCLGDLWLNGGNVMHTDPQPDGKEWERLPRGQFLFVGGDTAYHIADYQTLARRFQLPFGWAFQDRQPGDDRRPILGIPGNHDYYDALHGFNLEFRRPIWPEASFAELNTGASRRAQLSIPGFEREQQASYVAVRLPFEWWFWGIDSQNGEGDERQCAFFRQIQKDKDNDGCDKLIVATPEPTTVLGKRAGGDSTYAQLFGSLGLEPAFLNDGRGMNPGRCRLDLSGDVHHYARYWGPKPNGNASYASVVSGGGGAFMHPSHTNFGKVTAEPVYPAPDDSRKEVTKQLLKPWTMLKGGYIWLIGLLLAVVIYLGATVVPSSQSVVDDLLRQFVPVPGGSTPGVLPFGDLVVLLMLVGAAGLIWRLVQAKAKKVKKEPVEWQEYWGVFTLALAVLSIEDLFRRLGTVEPIHPFVLSLLLLAHVAISIWMLAAGFVYQHSLTDLAKHREIHRWRDSFPLWGLGTAVLVVAASGVSRYGVRPARVLAANGAFLLAVVGTLVGLVLFGIFAGGDKHGPVGRWGFAALGLWHGVLQIGSPFLLVRVGKDWTIGAALAITLLASLAVYALRGHRWVMLALWFLHGTAVLGLPLMWHAFSAAAPWRLGLVAALGVVYSAVWLGWYLLICLEFNGHNNEAGGAARLERFREFIRFRLTKEGLSGFVIGVDDTKEHGSELKPRLIDRFQIRP